MALSEAWKRKKNRTVQEENNYEMEIKFEINKELQYKQLLWRKLEGNYNN